ncbi:MAG: tRNA (N(6)-L-threonylcarbamoyladenosine(37)-C(2))-methylthiotransferase MtaB [Flavobacteriaceae bacterium TMED81]|nr:MAG: tRNA (N(6)-L-threonylcarbamoyladenosine(37)-C(2))-methylthiotransferase MtaB [Flavobacteriaceae bacterium TMED81]
MTSATVAFQTLGCKLNFSETSTLARKFVAAGYERVPFEMKADVCVINTCSVTENADKKFTTLARQTRQRNPDAFLIAVGCYAQLQPEELAKEDSVDLVLGAKEKFDIISYLSDLSRPEQTQVHACAIEETDTYVGSYAIGERTRAFLKVQDGCDYKCTYCTIPQARGISRSDSLDNVIRQAKEIVDQGIKEIVLTGVNIGDYGKGEFGNKKHEHTFFELVQALDEVEGIERFRISSIEPNLLTEELIEFVAGSKRFVPHFHIPLQSGNNEILGQMRRRYQRELYVDRVNQIKRLMPDACIGVDVIVGFPGESDQHFLDTYAFLVALPVSYLHVFSYSERPNTPAAEMKNQVSKTIKNKRSKMLRTLSAKKRHAFYESQLQKTKTILFEAENKEGYIQGFTENYVKVRVPWDPALQNQTRSATLAEIDQKGMVRLSKSVLV